MPSSKPSANAFAVKGHTLGITRNYSISRGRVGGINSVVVPSCPPGQVLPPVLPSGTTIQDSVWTSFFSSIAISGPSNNSIITLTRNSNNINIDTNTIATIYILPQGYSISDVACYSYIGNLGKCMYTLNIPSGIGYMVQSFNGCVDTPFSGLSIIPGMTLYIFLSAPDTKNYIGSCYYYYT